MKTQTDSNKYEGQCKFCGKDFTKREIIDHLDVCPKRKKDEKVNPVRKPALPHRSDRHHFYGLEKQLSNGVNNLRLRIIDSCIKNFWLIVEVNEQAKLQDLNNLIKKVWVECCGHLSLFGDYGKEISKERIIMDTLKPGDKLNYIYDFGSSTELTIEALKYSNYLLNEKKVELVARNYLPVSNCEKCGKQATWVCTACSDSEERMIFVCDECAEKYHNEETEGESHYGVSLSNSPRCGVCGYEPEESLDKLF